MRRGLSRAHLVVDPSPRAASCSLPWKGLGRTFSRLKSSKQLQLPCDAPRSPGPGALQSLHAGPPCCPVCALMSTQDFHMNEPFPVLTGLDV